MFNLYADKGVFPNGIKQGVITSIYKKDNPFDETNDRPISILTILLKAFENLSIILSSVVE